MARNLAIFSRDLRGVPSRCLRDLDEQYENDSKARRLTAGLSFFGVGMSRKTVVRALIAAAIAVSVFATIAYAVTWVELHSGITSMSSGTRAK
jgi:uncharacterized protein (DUF697 family)